MIRLNKYLKDQGYCSRRQADKWIEEGLIKIDGDKIFELGIKIDPDKNVITIDQKELKKKEEEKKYIILNKPKGYVTSTHHTAVEKKIVTDLIDLKIRLFPVGRLDKETTGMLLMTNDGDVSYQLTHPSFEHEKEYQVTVCKNIPEACLDKMRHGITLFGKKTLPAIIHRIDARTFTITLREGKNRQIRRMCRKVGYEVTKLKRIRIGKLLLPDIAEGKYKILSKEEVARLT